MPFMEKNFIYESMLIIVSCFHVVPKNRGRQRASERSDPRTRLQCDQGTGNQSGEEAPGCGGK